MDPVAVGQVVTLFRYPVKSMWGEELAEATLWWHGLAGDRKYAFLQRGDLSGFPWLTGREVPHLIRYAPHFADPSDPQASPILVRTPTGADLPLESEALRTELQEQYPRRPIDLLHLSRGAPDSMPLSLISQATLDQLGAWAGASLEPERFRPNVLVDLPAPAFAEEAWLGQRLQFGDRPDSARVRVNRCNVRCMMINLDPATAVQTPAVLRAVVQERDQQAGIYASTDRPGSIQAGDTVWLLGE